jgi:hypothetical protein
VYKSSPVISSNLSANVLFPWSTWAIILKFLIFSAGKYDVTQTYGNGHLEIRKMKIKRQIYLIQLDVVFKKKRLRCPFPYLCVTSYFMYRVSHEGKYCTKFLNQYNFICSQFYKLYKYNINISHNKTTVDDKTLCFTESMV